VKSLPSKRRILKKKREKEQGLKSKRGKTPFEKHHVSKKKKREDVIHKLLGEILLKKKERRSHFSYSAKSDVWPHPYPHIICIWTTFYSLTCPFLTPIHYTILHQPLLFATQTL
jgi:hypothetical protein